MLYAIKPLPCVDEHFLMVSVDVPKYAVDLLRLSIYLDFEKLIPAVALFVYSVFIDEVRHT